jgi:hypothetical protein
LDKIARFIRLENFSLYFQNDLAFLGQIGKISLSEFAEIYDIGVWVSGQSNVQKQKKNPCFSGPMHGKEVLLSILKLTHSDLC